MMPPEDTDVMDEFFETRQYDKTPKDWRDLPELAEEPDEEE